MLSFSLKLNWFNNVLMISLFRDVFLLLRSDKHVSGGELKSIKESTRSCVPAAAAFLVQTILQVFSGFVCLSLFFS